MKLAIILIQVGFIYTYLCNFNDECYDIQQQKCLKIDGQIYIGREKQQGMCISDSKPHNQVDFCYGKQNTVCMTKQKNQCVQILNEDKYKAIMEDNNICLELNENFSNRFQIQALSYIKVGYCQDLRGTIKQGKAQANSSNYYLCQEKFKLFGVGLCDSSNQCFNRLTGTCINLVLFAAGVTIDGVCVFPNNYFSQKVMCNQNYCLFENNQKKQSCQPYNQSTLIFGKTQSNQCVYFYQQTTDLQMTCKNSFCKYLKNNKVTCLSIEASISPKGFTQEGDCVIEEQEISQSLILTCLASHSKVKTQFYQKCVKQDEVIEKKQPEQNRLLNSCSDGSGCYDQNQDQCIYISNSDDHQDICFLNQYCQQISSSLYIGRDNSYICLQNMQSSSNGVNFCINRPSQICLKADSSQCIQYSSSSIYLGYIVGSGVCAQQNQRTSSNYTPQSLINLNPNYCQDSNSVIRRINFPIIGRDGSSQQNCVIFTCGPGYCIYQQTCKPLGFDGIYFAKLSNGYCGQAYQSDAVQCAYPSYQICLSGNVCQWLNINNYQASNLINIQGYKNIKIGIGVCEQHHCIKSSSDNTQYACYLLDGSQGQVGVSSSGDCLDLNQSPAIRCVQNNNSFCYNSATQQCWLTVNFQQVNNGCTLNKQCYQLSNSQYVGRDNNLNCLTNTQQSSFGVDICFNDPYNVCLVSQSNPFCVIFPQSTQYLGYILETKQCAQLNQRTLSDSPANLVNLKIGYCQDQNGYIRQLNSTFYLGVDSFKYMCLQQNETTSTQIIQCYSGFCINTNKCQAYDQTNIGRDANYNCLTEGTAVSTECSFDIYVCFDPTVQACFYINDINPNQSGRAQNGQCAVSSQYYTKIQSCAFNHCKLKMDPNNPNSLEGCFEFDAIEQRVGIDANGYCVFQDQPNAVRCMKGQFCLDYQNGYSCRSLVFSKDIIRYARQKDTQFCLPYLDINGNGDLVETCVQGTCIYTYFKTMKNYCLIEGTLAKGDFIVGTDILGYCVLQDQLTAIQNSIGCMDGLYCINTLDNSKCEAMISPTDYKKIGRDEKTHNCLRQGIQQPNKCQNEYCISQGVCIPLQNKYPGKEYKTHICLAEKQTGNQGASNCYQNGYCLLTDPDGKLSCYKLDFTNPNLIGIEKDTQLCLPEKQAIAVMCASGLYCLDRDTQSCIIIDASIGMCADPDGYCVTNGSCNSCKFNQCLSTSINNTCQDLVQPSVTYCTNNQGFCSSVTSKNCVVCPNNYCMIKNNGACLTSVNLLKKLVGNSCFIQNQSNSSCIMKNIDIPDSNGNMYCTNNEGFCQIISQNNSNCLLCPKYYTNPGNDICYSLAQKSGLSPNPQQLYFDMQLTYVKQDCYDQQYCLLDPTKKCSTGSQNSANPYKTCINYIVHYDNATQIVENVLKSINFLVTSNSQSIVLNKYNTTLCPTGCLSCAQNSFNSASCIQCQIGYVLYFGDCIQCPKNCDYCQYASFITGYAQLITQINFDPSFSSYYNFILICLKQNNEEILNYDIKASRILSQNEVMQKGYIKKCSQCANGYFINFDGVSCQKNLQYCSYSTTLVTQGSQSIDFTEKLWEFKSSYSSSESKYICKQCIDGYIISKNKLSCNFGCRTNSQLSKCSNCQISANNSNQCLFCSNGNVLNQAIDPPKCQDELCKNNIYGCSECYSYFDQNNYQIYQCTKCADQYSIPTINGCIKCPLGCSKCYEGTRTYNFTSFLIYKRQKYDVQQRLNYNTKSNNYNLYCTECQDGYYFDQQQKLCLQIQCGQNCLLCALINNKPQCIQCDYDKLESLVNQFSYFIGILYFQQNNIPNIQDMVTLTQSVNDKSRRKCYLCQNSEQGCFYKKQKTIYTQCLDLNNKLGDGSLQNPVNYNRLNEVNIDQLILSEIEYNQAIVYYNELQVKQLEVKLVFLGDQCVEAKPQTFITTLKKQIRSLQLISINITSITNQPSSPIQFLQLSAFNISGFDQATFGYISLGFYFKAPTVQITFTKANFKDQDAKSLFSWIQGVAKSISFQQCNFTNTFQFDQASYFKSKQLKKGGHIYIQAETFTVQYSRFVNGFALYGGSIYWIAKSFGKMYVFNCTFDSNTAFSYDDHESEGGALFIDNQISASLEIIIEQSFFFSNFAQWKGGAIQFVQTSLPRTAVFFLNTQFINNLSSQGSNFNIENQKTSKTIVVMKNIDSINQIDFMLKKIQLIIPLINSFSWQESQYQQSSIFYLNNPYDVQIFNSKFQIYSDNIQSIQPQFINILLFQRLFIINNANKIIDSSNNYQFSHYLDNLVTITQAQELYIYNSTLLNNKNIFDLLDTPSQKMMINTVQYDSIKCYIYQFKSFNNECKYCNQGTIYVLSNSLLVLQSIFQKNVAQYGSALYIQNNLSNNNSILDSKQFNFQITESQFLNNHANMKGGAIFIKQTPLIITSSNFIENLATNQGGAIYLENSQQDILQNALSFQTSNFVKNQAQLGGAIASNIGQSINYYQNNTFSQNKASIYGQNIQVSPNQLNVYIDGILQNFTQAQTQQIIVSNHQGGQIKQNIVFKFSTEQNEEIVNLSSNIILNLQLQNGQGYINKNVLQQQSGVFNLTKQIQVYGNMGQQITLSITSDLIQRPQYNSSNYIVGYDKNYQLILIIQFAKICPTGLVKKNIYGQFNYCFPCQDSYSFTNSDACFKCPNTDVKCFGNQILLTSNYWRVNQQSAQLFDCKNCLGEYPINTNQIQVAKYRKILSDQNYYCQIGHIGALCEDCDVSGEYWGQRYFMNLDQKCQKCSDINPSQILYPLCLSIVILFIITKMTQSYQLQVRNNMLYISCQNLFKKQILYVQQNSVNIMKLLLFQLFVIGTIFNYDQKSPNIVSLILIDIKCQNFDTQSFVTDYLSQYCDETQLKLSYYVFAPLYILTLLTQQAFFLYKLYKMRYFLNSYKNKIIYGYFTQEYKQKFFFWDQVQNIVEEINNQDIMKKMKQIAFIKLLFTLVYSFCEKNNQCYNPLQAICVDIDGFLFIGKEASSQICIFNQIHNDHLDSQCKQNDYCLDKYTNKCIQIQRSDVYVAVDQQSRQCIGLNQYLSSEMKIQPLSFIKEGFCQNQYGLVLSGIPIQNGSNYSICKQMDYINPKSCNSEQKYINGTFKKNYENLLKYSSCYDQNLNKCIDTLLVLGKTIDGLCINDGNYYLQKINCNKNYCIYQKNQMATCLLKDSNLITGETIQNYCVTFNQYFPHNQILCKNQYCKHSVGKFATCLSLKGNLIDYKNGIDQNRNCIFSQDNLNTFKYFLLASKSIKRQIQDIKMKNNVSSPTQEQNKNRLLNNCLVQPQNCVDPNTNQCLLITSDQSFSNICIYNGVCYQMSITMYIGRDNLYQCITDQQIPSSGVVDSCFNSPNDICLKDDKTQCVLYQSSQIYLGYISNTGFCAEQNKKTNLSQLQNIINLNQNYCQDDQFTIVQIQFPYIGRNQTYQQCIKQQCLLGYCYYQSQCQQVGFDGLNIAILSNGFCAQANQNGAVYCAQNYDVCLYQSQCIELSDQNLNASGVDQQGNCIKRGQFISNLRKCEKHHCMTKSSDQTQISCNLFNGLQGAVGVTADNYCLDFNQSPAQQCYNQNNICYDPQSKACYQTINFGLNGNGCILNSQCFQLSNSLYIGRDLNGFQCLTNMQIAQGGVDKCFDDPRNICLVNGSKQFCVLYQNNLQYLGFISQNKQCAVLDQLTYQIGIISSLINLKQNYCQDNQGYIRQIDSSTNIGIQSSNYLCLQINQQASSQIIQCYTGYCINSNQCQSYDSNYIGRDITYNCLTNQQPNSVECTSDSQVCLDLNLSQCVYINNNEPGHSSSQYYSQIKSCSSNYCILKQDITNQNSQEGCFPFDITAQRVGIDINGYCVQLNQPNTVSCKIAQTTCFDPNQNQCKLTVDYGSQGNGCILNGQCYQLSNVLYVGRDSNLNCLTNLQQAQQGIDICFNDSQNVCLANESTQFCVIYPQSSQYLGYVVENKYCAVLNQVAYQVGKQAGKQIFFKIIGKYLIFYNLGLINLKKNYCQDSSGYIRLLDNQNNIGVDSFNFMCLRQNQIPKASAIQCFSGYCIEGNACKLYNLVNIGRDINYNCLSNGQSNSVECSSNNQVCYDKNQQACFLINNTEPNHSGRQQNGQCAVSGQYYSQIARCSTNYCKIKQDPTDQNSKEGCFPFDINLQRVGVDNNGYCVQLNSPTAVSCTQQTSTICYDLNSKQCKTTVDYGSLGNGCILNTYCYQLSNYLYVGRDQNLNCLTNLQQSIAVDVCFDDNQNICQVKASTQYCVIYPQNPQYLGYVVQNKQCAILNTIAFQLGILADLINLKLNYCQDSQGYIRPLDSKTNVGVDSFNYMCLQQNQLPQNQIIQCFVGFCINMNMCIPYDQNYIGRDINYNCQISRQQNSVECSQNNQICLDINKKICVYINNVEAAYAGRQINSYCATSGIYYPQITQCSTSYCKQKLNSYQEGCFLFDITAQRVGIDANGYCLQIGQSTAVSCGVNSYTICFDPQMKKCQQTINYGSNGNGCTLNNQCFYLSQSLYVGRDINQYQCLLDQQQSVGGVDTCLNDQQNVCLVSSNTQFCVIYPKSAIYIGYIVETKQCAVQGQLTNILGIPSNLVNLRQNYCQDSQGYIRMIDNLVNIGVDQFKFMCLNQNQQAQQKVIQCFSGFCITNNQCQQYDLTFLGRNSSYQCLINGMPTSVECSSDSQVCFDQSIQACFLINDTEQNHSGRQQNGQCAIRGQFYQQIQACAFNHCKYKQDATNLNSNEGCFPFDASIQRIGIDADGYCVQKNLPNAVRCMAGQFCLDNLNGFKCVDLLLKENLNCYARQKITGYCLPFQSPLGNGDSIETCAKGSCLYTYTQTMKDFCFTEGTFAKGDQIIGTDIQQQCLIQDQVTNTQIVSCLGITYCILNLGGGNQKCQLVQIYDPNYPNLIYKAKNVNQQCQDLNMQNSIGCANGLYCLNTNNNYQCEAMTSPNDTNKIGRDYQTQICLPQGVKYVSKCQQQFCILQGECVPLSDKYPGKESSTHLCLLPQATGKYGASNCYTNGYCLLANSTGLNSCYKLSYSNSKTIGIQKDTSRCLKESQSIAIQCAPGKFCLDIKSQSCKSIQTSQGMCIDQNGYCVFNGNCKKCDYSQCLSTTVQNTCVNLVQQQITYCADSKGFCASLSSSNCSVCPNNYCILNNNGKCVTSENLLSLIVGKQCFVQYYDQSQCVIQNIDAPNSNGDIYCTNIQGFCQDISTNSKQCLLCPLHYTNPGNQQCYSAEEIAQLQAIPQQLYFDMQLTYVKEDCYDQHFCLLDSTKKCPLGCYSCDSNSYCTKCIQGYFLYKLSASQQLCLKCDNQIYQYTQIVKYYTNAPTYTCLDCSSEFGIWNDVGNQYKTCINYIAQLDTNTQVVINQLQANNFIVDSNLTLVSYSSTLCSLGCQSCIQSLLNQAVCVQCAYGYVLSNGICQQCPDNCKICQFATFITGFAQLKTKINYDPSQEQFYNFQLICLSCQFGYLVSFDLQQCQKCGNNCDYCQYENQESVLNYNPQALRMISQQEFNDKQYIKKCIQCSDGYFLSFDGIQCQQFISQCFHNSVIVKQGALSLDLSENLWSFQQNATQISFICKQCNDGYTIQNNQQECKYGCRATVSQTKCSNCLDNQSNTQCLFCNNGSILNLSYNPPKCQDDTCQKNNFGCAQCYYYKDPNSTSLIYQCTSCFDSYSIPSVNGCIKCPQGCSKCYEGNRTFNFTSQLIYKRTQLSVQQRLNYNNTSTNYQLFCTECQQGYYFDQQQKTCIAIQCGQYCSLCILINNKPQCIQCNYDKLLQLISSIQYFIGTLYYKQNSIPNIQSMVSLTSKGDDCQICPLMCQTCTNENDISQNPLFLYDSQCLSCKQNLNFIIQNYKITYDKERRKCYMCQNTEQGCYYKKQRTIYTKCLNQNSQLGDGSQQNPLNFNRINEVNIDELILNELQYDQAIVYYNELQVKELEVQLIFLEDQCVEQKNQVFITQLQNQIRSLQLISLNITSQTSDPNNYMQFQQLQPFTVAGFNQIFVEKINFQQQFNNSFFGLIVQEIVLQYVQFQNIQVDSNSKLIDILTAPQDVQISLTIDQTQFINVVMSSASLFSLNVFGANINITNSSFYQSQFNDDTQIFDIQPVYIKNQQVKVLFNNVSISQCQFTNGSCILNSQFLNDLIITNMKFNQSNLTQNFVQNTPLITSNTFNVTNFQIQNTFIKNYGFLRQQDSLSDLENMNQLSIFQDVIIIENQIFSENMNSLFLDYYTQLRTSSQILRFYLQRNNFQSQNLQQLISLTNLQKAQIQNITLIDNNQFLFLKTDSVSSVYIQQVSQFQTQINLISPIICQISQSLNFISIDSFNLKDIRISENFIQIKNNELNLNEQNYSSNLLAPTAGIVINNIICNKVTIVIQENLQDCALFSINSVQETTIQIKNVVFQQFQSQLLLKGIPLGSVCLGFFFKASTIQVIIDQSNFTDSYIDNPFSWVSGQVKILNITNSNFTNTVGLNQNNYQSLKSIKNGGFVMITSEIISSFNSLFANGLALFGGAIFWSPKSKGNISFQNSTFIGNYAFSIDSSESKGGAVFVDSQFSNSQDINIQNCQFQSNFASYGGGAIWFQTSNLPRSFIQIKSSVFENNFSILGSNVYINNQLSAKTIVIINDIVSHNQIEKITDNIQFFINIQAPIQQNIISSIFYINRANYVYVQNSQFKIFSNKSRYLNKDFINVVVFQKILLITNAKTLLDFNNIYETSIFLDNLINFNQIFQIYIYNSTIQNNSNIYAFQQQTNPNQSIQNIAFYNSTYCQIQLLNSKNNFCQQCSQGIIQVSAEFINIYQSYFDSNTALHGSGLYIQQNQIAGLQSKRNLQLSNINNWIYIQNSQFYNNNVYGNGGAIYVNNSSIQILKCQFNHNVAKSEGGAIYLNNKLSQILTNVLELKDCLFDSNFAQYGGAISSSTGQSVNQYQNNTYKNNTAQKYGQIIKQSPMLFDIKVNSKQVKTYNYLPQIDIFNHEGGQLNDDIILVLSNQNSEKMQESDLNLQVSIQTGYGYISTKSLVNKNGVFNITDQLFIYGLMGSRLQIQITSNVIKIPIYSSDQNVIGYNQGYKLVLNIYFAQTCQIGKIAKKIYEYYDYCIQCKDSYSFIVTDSCFQCPKNDVTCSGDNIYLSSQYWRVNKNSSDLYQCSNCIGDQSQSEAQKQIYQKRVQVSDLDYYCKEGYIGALCEDCDRRGQFWGFQYAKNLKNKCQKCSEISVMEILYPFLFMILSICIIIYMVQSYQNDLQNNLLTKVLYITFQQRIECSKAQPVLKFFLIEIYIIGVVMSYDTNFSHFFSNLFLDLGNLFNSQLRVFECFLEKMSNADILIKGLLFLLLIWLTSYLFLISYFLIRKLYFNERKALIKIFVATQIYIYYTQNAVLTKLYKLIICQHFGGVLFVTEYLSSYCDNNQQKLTHFLFSPLYMLVFMMPLLILIFRMQNKRFYLHQYKYQMIYGFFTREYKYKYYFWDFIKLIFKQILCMILYSSYQPTNLQTIFSILLSLTYCLLVFACKPYKEDKLNDIDFKIQYKIALCFSLNLIISQLSSSFFQVLTNLAYIYLVLIILYYILITMNINLKINLLKFLNYLQTKSKVGKYLIKLLFLSNFVNKYFKSLDNWKKLRSLLDSKEKTQFQYFYKYLNNQNFIMMKKFYQKKRTLNQSSKIRLNTIQNKVKQYV
ncbi:hypothetical protein ABPG73_004486 [Tetrahymena malaccensis]